MTLTRQRTDGGTVAKTRELIEKRETITTRIMDRQLRKEIREDVLEALKAGLAQM